MKIDTDTKSKWFDGIFSMVLIFLSMMVLIFLIRPFEKFGDTGHLVYGIVMLIAGTWCLVRAKTERLSEIGRAWYGVFAGMFIWTVTEMGQVLGWVGIEDWDGAYLVVLVFALLWALWAFFPSGVKVAIMIFMFNWGGHVFIHLLEHGFSGAALQSVWSISAILYGLLSLAAVFFIFARTQTRLQRFWGAVWLWHFVSMGVFILRQ